MNKNYTLIPDSVFSGLNDTTVYLSDVDISDIFETHNIELALNDTIRIYISTTFGTYQQANLNKWADSLSNWTGIPIYKKQTQYNTSINSSFNPYTVNHSTIGTDILPGTSNTLPYTYTMPSTGQSVKVYADMTTGGYAEQEFFKEMGRLIGFGEVTTRTSVMNPVPATISDKDIASYTIHYKIGKALYRENKQELSTMQYLRDNSTIIPDQ
jgi:hypothetical protein